MNERVIQSVGIDIGTTTTQLVFSLLRLRNIAGMTQAPRYGITDRDIVYKSSVAFTPFKAHGTLDAERLRLMISQWYTDAGKTIADIESGAVIITGESLKAANAKGLVMDMVAGLGDFVVASAGPHLESVLAGRGAGAATRSRTHPGYHLNVDIGGGTSNYAVFEWGKVVDTACLNVGGRLIEADLEGHITHVSEPAQSIVRDVTGADSLASEHLPAVLERMVDMICSVLLGHPDTLSLQLLQTPPLKKSYDFATVSVSGGVGACLTEYGGNPYRFGDIGPLLADALGLRFAAMAMGLEAADNPVRATVIGAGVWSLTLSGGTVWTQAHILPLRNVPVVLVAVDWKSPPRDLAANIAASVARLDLDTAEVFILAFSAGSAVNYGTVQWLAQGINTFYDRMFVEPQGRLRPILVSVEDDMGKALGMELCSLTSRPLIIVDEVRLEEGDYIDLARSLGMGGGVPLTIKSLAFPAASAR